MRKVMCRLFGMCFPAVSLAVLAESGDTMKQDTMSQDSMKADTMAQKAVSVSGNVSNDGKMAVPAA